MYSWEANLEKGFTQNDEDFICITDIARYKDADGMDDLIRNWLRNRKKTLAIIRVHSRLIIMRTTDGNTYRCHLNELVRYTFANRLLQRSELDKKNGLPFMLIYSESK